MGFLDWLFGRRATVTDTSKQTIQNMAFVLLSEAQLPEGEALAAAFKRFCARGERLIVDGPPLRADGAAEVLSVRLTSGETAFIGLLPVPVPNGEAERFVRFSLSSMGRSWTLAPHSGHLIVTLRAPQGERPVVALTRFTSLLAAVVASTPALAVYSGGAGATHEAEFFITTAADRSVSTRTMLWSGLDVQRGADGRTSLLSLGMKQLGQPDLLLRVTSTPPADALTWMLDLLSYVAERDAPLPDGDTIGRTPEEKLTVRYVPSPSDPDTQVCLIDLP